MSSLKNLETLFTVLRKDVLYEIKLHTLQVFLAVANSEEPIDSIALQQRVGLDQRTLNRDVTLLGVRMITDANGSRKQTGFDLVEARPDMHETRRLAYSLTPKGKELYAKMIQICNTIPACGK